MYAWVLYKSPSCGPAGGQSNPLLVLGSTCINAERLYTGKWFCKS